MLTVHITFYNKNGLPQIKVIRKNIINLIAHIVCADTIEQRFLSVMISQMADQNT